MSDETLRKALESMAVELERDGAAYWNNEDVAKWIRSQLADHPAPNPGTMRLAAGRIVGACSTDVPQDEKIAYAIEQIAAFVSSGDSLREAFLCGVDYGHARGTLESDMIGPLSETEADRRYPHYPAGDTNQDDNARPAQEPTKEQLKARIHEAFSIGPEEMFAPEPKETRYICQSCGLEGKERFGWHRRPDGEVCPRPDVEPAVPAQEPAYVCKGCGDPVPPEHVLTNGGHLYRGWEMWHKRGKLECGPVGKAT